MYFDLTAKLVIIPTCDTANLVKRLNAAKSSQERYMRFDDPFDCRLDPLFNLRMSLASRFGGKFSGTWCKALEIFGAFGPALGFLRLTNGEYRVPRTLVISSPDSQRSIPRAISQHIFGMPNYTFDGGVIRVFTPKFAFRPVTINEDLPLGDITCKYWSGDHSIAAPLGVDEAIGEFSADPAELVYADINSMYPNGYRIGPEYNNQENYAAMSTNFAAMLALCSLCNGGSLVLKLYTLFEEHTRSLIYRLANKFERACLYKPVSSHGNNSEVFLICSGYGGFATMDFACLRGMIIAGNCSPMLRSIGPDFDSISQELAEKQISAISRVNNVRANHAALRSYHTKCNVEADFRRITALVGV